jgi:hypothetical protein
MDGITKHHIERRLEHIEHMIGRLEWMVENIIQRLNQKPFSTSISFTETTMLPVEAGNTLVYTGVLAPAGSILAPDFVATVTSNDPAILPTVDSTGLIVTVPLPAGWVESTTTPLVIAYATTSASTGQALSATITPGAEVIPPVLATSITFNQTT